MVGGYPARSELKVEHGVMVLGMRHEGLDSAVTSSSSYLNSSEVCQEWILKPFKVEIDRVRSGFEDGMKI